MAYKELKSNVEFWKPLEEGTSIEGEVIEIREDPKYGRSVILKTAKGDRVCTPSHSALQNLLVDVKLGHKLKVLYVGEMETKDGKQKFRGYRVFRDE